MMVEYLFLAIAIFLPFQFALNVGENIDLVTTRILVPAVFLMWLLRGFSRKKVWISDKAETWLILSFLFFSLISLWAGFGWAKGMRKMLYLLSLTPVYFVAADLLRNKDFQKKAVRAIWISGALSAAAGLFQFSLPFILGLEPTLKIWKELAPFFLGSAFGKLVTTNPSWLVNVSGETWMRAFGLFPDPHAFSLFASLCFFTALGYFVWEKNKKWKIFSGTSALLMILAIIFSFSRGAYLGVITGSLFFLAIFLKMEGHLKKVFAAGVVLLVVSLVFLRGTVQNRLASTFNPKEGSNVERLKNWRQAAEAIRDYPLTGIGLGGYSSYIDPMAKERSSIYSHNMLLDITAET